MEGITTSSHHDSREDQLRTLSFVDDLDDAFLSIARECVPLKDNEQNLAPAVERADALEIRLRSEILTLVQESLSDDEDALAGVGKLWKFSLEFCLHLTYFCEQGKDERYKGMSVRKLPLLLLEDALDSLPLESFKSIWEGYVEPSFPILFSDIMWNPSPKSFPCALPFIKLCNKLLRKLHLEKGSWPGRILLTLAKAFPLSDKSATKTWGSFNTDNVTEFETEEEFEAHQQEYKQQDQAEENELLYPHNKKNQTYSFYGMFWSVQQDFSNPSAIKVADFLERMRTVLAALESHPLIRPNRSQGPGDYRHQQVKYLTGSHLLPIQLGDPEFRIHFLTQFLIVEKHLSTESSALGSALLPLQTRAKSMLQHIYPHGPTHLEIVDFVLNHREIHWRQWKKNKCQPDIEMHLVEAGNGKDMSGKKRKRLMDGALGGDDTVDAAMRSEKDEEQKLIDFILYEKKDLKATCALSLSPQSDEANKQSKRHISSPSKNTLDSVVPSLEEHLADYIEALDPEAGIEGEYHPKNDSLFTWRALRLLSREHLGKFHMINHGGDFERMVRHIYKEEKGIEIPGQAPMDEPATSAVELNGVISAEDHDHAVDEEMESQERSPEEDISGVSTHSDEIQRDVKNSEEHEGGRDNEADKKREMEHQALPAAMDTEEPESAGPSQEKGGNVSDDDGEIEESKARKGMEASSPSSPPPSKEGSIDDPDNMLPANSDKLEKRDSGRHDNDKEQGTEQRRGRGSSRDRPENSNSRPSSPTHRGGGGGRDRKSDLPSSYNSMAEKRENSRGDDPHHRVGGGLPSRSDSRGHDLGPPGRQDSRIRDSGRGSAGRRGGRDIHAGGSRRKDDRRGLDERRDEGRGARDDRRGGGGGGGGGGGRTRDRRGGRGDSTRRR